MTKVSVSNCCDFTGYAPACTAASLACACPCSILHLQGPCSNSANKLHSAQHTPLHACTLMRTFCTALHCTLHCTCLPALSAPSLLLLFPVSPCLLPVGPACRPCASLSWVVPPRPHRLHKHVKARLLKDRPSSSSGLRVAAAAAPQPSPFVFKVTASLGDDAPSSTDTPSVGAAAAAAPPPHTGLGVASTPTPSRSNNSTRTTSSSSDDRARVAAVQRPRGAVLEVPEGFDGGQFVDAVQSAHDVSSIYPDRIISITQGVGHTHEL